MSNYPEGCKFPEEYYICERCGNKQEHEVNEVMLCDSCEKEVEENKGVADSFNNLSLFLLPQWNEITAKKVGLL